MDKTLKLLLISLFVYLTGSAFISPLNTNDILTQSPWVKVEIWKDTDGDGVFTFETEECEGDNHWNFLPSAEFQITEESIKCEPELTFLDTIVGNWRLLNNETLLNFSYPEEDPINFDIVEIGENYLELNLIPETGPVTEKIMLRR